MKLTRLIRALALACAVIAVGAFARTPSADAATAWTLEANLSGGWTTLTSGSPNLFYDTVFSNGGVPLTAADGSLFALQFNTTFQELVSDTGIITQTLHFNGDRVTKLSDAAGTLELRFTVEGIASPVTPPSIDFTHAFSGTPDSNAAGHAGSYADYTSAVGPGDVLPATGPPALSDAGVALDDGSGGHSGSSSSTIFTLTDPTYSITQYVTIHLDRISSSVSNREYTGFDLLTTLVQDETGAVPEPASMAIWGIGGLGLVAFSRYRRRLLGR